MEVMTKEEFIVKARSVHGDKYDYSKVDYVNARTKVCIICPEHGEFWQEAFSHTTGCGCPSCVKKKKYTTESFIEKTKTVHGDKYDYTKTEYINNRTKVCIICPEHGEFWQLPTNHLKGCGCTFCKGARITKEKTRTKEDFIKKAIKVHGDRYDYSKVNYVKARDKVCIICPEHGEFWQEAYHHTVGCGCPHCKKWFLEEACSTFLVENNISFVREKTFKWLRAKNPLHLDFYLPKYNLAIECQGKQHFKVIKTWGGEDGLKARQDRDKIKAALCQKNNVNIEYISYTDNVDECLEKIIKKYESAS